jgi:3-hydroxymyristoyl/3-hydroxydecanoyl-(acyl carrier protein) dehydratase
MPDSPAHFAAFSFVDRIHEFLPRTQARGSFTVPAGVRFPACLIAEAVGQLAAWVSMEAVEFRGRPIAALAGATRFHGTVAPDSLLELGADIESCDDDGVAYAGWAAVGGKRVIELAECFGPVLPLAEFDEPDALRQRFLLLRGAGAPAGRFGGVERFALRPAGGDTGRNRRAVLEVPDHAPFFADHFPRRAVFPATLLLDAQIGLALELAAEAGPWPAGTPLAAARLTRVKVRSFTAPGQRVELAAELVAAGAVEVALALSAAIDGKTVATAEVAILATRNGEPSS